MNVTVGKTRAIWEPVPNSPQAHFMSRTESEGLYGGAAGGMKASANDAMILTPFSWKRMEEIEVGSQLLNPDDTVQKVIGIYPQGEQDIYRFTFIDGASTEVTKDHLWLINKTRSRVKGDRRYYPFSEQDKIRVKLWTTAQIIEFFEKKARASSDDYIQTQNLCVPLCEPLSFTRSYRFNPCTVEPYLLGVLLGDGTITGGGVRLSCGDNEIIEEIQELGYDVTQYGGIEYGILNKDDLIGRLKSLELWGHTCEDKFIPECYKWMSFEDRLALIQGLFDTDGTATKDGKVNFCTISEQLAKDVQYLIRSIGGKATISKTQPQYTHGGEKKNGQPAYQIYIKTKNDKQLFRLSRKIELAQQEYNGGASELMRQILGVEFVGRKQATCIKVDHPNSLYITDDFIVTHNTETLMHWPVKDLLRIPGIQALFLRREYAQLRDVLQRAQQFFIPLGAKYNASTRTFKFQNGSIYEFNGLQHEGDKYNFQGRAFDRIVFDELTQFTETQYLYLFSRNRGLNNPDLAGRVRAGTNPGGVGHGWCKRRFVDALVPYRTRFFLRINNEDIRVHPETPFAKSRFWIPARVQDNPFYRDTEYVSNLMALPEDERRALLEGDWTVFSGQFFKMWRRSIHVLEPFDLPQDWRYFGAYDYGYSSPACYLLMAVDYDGNVYVVREMYQEELSIKEQADRIKEIEKDIKVAARIADTQIFEHRKKDEAGTDDTIALTFQKHGLDFIKANKDRMNGWAAMKEYMSWQGNYDGTIQSLTQRPAFYVTANCSNFIRETEDAVYSSSDAAYIGNKKTRIEDLDTKGSDHALDPGRYGLMFVYKPRKIAKREPTWQEKFMPQKKRAKGILHFS